MATSVVLNPNFLASEVGLVLKTIGLDLTTHKDYLDKTETTVVKAGKVISTGTMKGIIFQDVDLAGSSATAQVPAPIMVAGYYIASKVSGTTTDLAAQGLFSMSEPAVSRPN